mmetsp:Transcript_16918/g.32749  ORF Transcript_16918/g.32749 Transcript_16918/m.32749 type:complete len:245 (-) Transcript_16918:722-1456(-)
MALDQPCVEGTATVAATRAACASASCTSLLISNSLSSSPSRATLARPCSVKATRSEGAGWEACACMRATLSCCLARATLCITSLARVLGWPRSVNRIKLLGTPAQSEKSSRAGPTSRDPIDAITTFGPGPSARSSSFEWQRCKCLVVKALVRWWSNELEMASFIHSKWLLANSRVLYATLVMSTSWYAPSLACVHISSRVSTSSSTLPAVSTGMRTLPSDRSTFNRTSERSLSARALEGGRSAV